MWSRERGTWLKRRTWPAPGSTQRRRPASDINQTFEELYRSLLEKEYEEEETFGQKRTDYAAFERSRHSVAISVTSTTTEKNITLSASDSSNFLRDKSSGKGNPTLSGSKSILRELKQSVEDQYVSVNFNVMGNTHPKEDLPSEENFDSGVQDICDISFGNTDAFSCRSSNEDECNSIVDILPGNVVEKQLLCKSCQSLKNKVIKNKTTGIKLFKIFDPNHWCSDHWMLKNTGPQNDTTPHLGTKRTISKALKNIAALKLNLPMNTHRISFKCSRPHSFLQRNLFLCKMAKQNLCNVPLKQQQRTSTNYNANKQRQKKTVSKQPYMLVVGKNQDEDSDKDGKRGKLKANKKMLISDTSPPRNGDRPLAPTSTTKKKLPRLENRNILPSKDYTVTSLCNNKDLLENEFQDPFSWVDGGSFRDMLAHLNSGRSNSAIIKEH
ncbi:Hypothetical predicted protein [Pelobates cultripes]|uniref:Uncharacterized protein n=1 Tax=Pelobates cultripes TaxID=61616 RepID=A0AAD1SPW2_PELCU|nr:Hypothetical predicted protein [Pelobates cultripes]